MKIVHLPRQAGTETQNQDLFNDTVHNVDFIPPLSISVEFVVVD